MRLFCQNFIKICYDEKNTLRKNMHKKPKIIFFDIDDTLYIKSENRIPTSTIHALQKLKQQGIMVAIATGRGKGVFPPCIHQIIEEIGIDLLVTINGQYVEYRGNCLIDFPLKNVQIQEVTNYLISQNIAYGYMTVDKIFVFDETPALTNALTSLHIPYHTIKAEDFDKSLPIYQILAFYDDNRTANLHFAEQLKTVRWHVSGVDILDKHGSKMRGISAVLQHLNILSEDVWAFGDGLNDIEMLQSVGFGVAVGNAHPDLKAVADFVADDIKNDGIFKSLQQLNIID